MLREALRPSHDCATLRYYKNRLLLPVQREDDINRGVHFHRFTIESRRLILPLSYGVERGLYQQWMPRENFELLHRARSWK